MIKKAIALFSAFATVFAFAACGKLEGEEVTTKQVPTNLYVEDKNGVTVPVVTKVDGDKVIYEYTDSEGNKVTVNNPDDIISVTKYSPEQLEQLEQFEELSKQFEENPEDFVEEEVDFILSEGLVPEDKLVKIDVELGKDGKPVRTEAKKYEETFTKDTFTFRINATSYIDGVKTNTPMSCYRSGKNMLLEVVGPFDSGTTMKGSILFKDGKCYMIMPSMKMYYQLPDEMAKDMFNTDMFDQAFENAEVEDKGNYIASYSVKLNGKNYECDVYETEEGVINKVYFDSNGTIARTEIIHGEDNTIWEILEISDKCDNSVFKIPDGLLNVTAFIENK